MTECRQVYYSGSDGEQNLSWLHYPADRKTRYPGVVLCPPLGYEHTHAYRTLRVLAQRLAEAGVCVIRFDYPGTGDAEGNHLLTSGWVDSALGAIGRHVRDMQQVTGMEQVTIAGLRLGATLASQVAASVSTANLLLWQPCRSGKRFLRETRAISALSSAENATSGLLESAGFAMSETVAEEIAQLRLRSTGWEGRVLWIERDDLTGSPIPETEAMSVVRQSDYSAMMDEPHRSRLPETSIQAAVNWATTDSPRDTPTALTPAPSLKSSMQTVRYTETPQFVTANNPLFGVLCTPAAPVPGGQVVLLANAGCVHHSGPNRVYTELARHLASHGLSSFRFDFSHLGDSLVLPCEQENHPYPPFAVAEMKSVVAAMTDRFGFDRAILAGLCSGGHAAYHTGLAAESCGPEELLLINPLEFYWQPGMQVRFPAEFAFHTVGRSYQSAMSVADKWLGLIRSPGKILHGLRHAGHYLRHHVMRLGRYWRLLPQTRLSRDLLKLARSGCRVRFIISEDDPGLNILHSQAEGTLRRLMADGGLTLDLIAGADHTLTSSVARAELYRLAAARLDSGSTRRHEPSQEVHNAR